MKRKVFRILKILGMALLTCIGLSFLILLLDPARLNPPVKSDFAQDYFLAKAVVAGIDPYLPLNELGARFGIPDQIPHSSTHPPSFAVLCLPLALLSFQHAAFLWLIIGLISLMISLHLLFKVKGVGLPVIFLAAIAWPPVLFDLSLGQLMLPQLLVLTLAWLALRSDRDLIGGLFLGLTVSIKLIVWPVLILLIFKKRFRAGLAAFGVIAITNLIALLLMGVHPIVTYYLKTGREIASIYSNNAFNFSAWTTGARLFAGTSSVDASWFHTTPLINAPALVHLTSMVCVVAILAYAFFVALKAQTFDTSFAVLVCAALLVSPVAWIFYLTLLLPSFAILRTAVDWQPQLTIVLCLIAPFVSQTILPVFGSSTSFAIALLMLFPLGAVLLLINAHHHQDRKAHRTKSIPDLKLSEQA
jgi:hypothetical protein